METTDTQDITHPVLERYYARVWTLASYLDATEGGDSAEYRAAGHATGSYAQVLQSTYIATGSTSDDAPCPPLDNNDCVSLNALLRRVQCDVLSNPAKEENVICYGHRMVRETAVGGRVFFVADNEL